MNIHGLVTIDLPHNCDDKQRKAFYSTLKNENWSKIDFVTTAWTMIFEKDVNTKDAISIIEADLKKAKLESKVATVEYVCQLGIIPILGKKKL